MPEHKINRISRNFSFDEIRSTDIYKKEYSDEEILKMNLELAELLGLKLNIETMELY